MVSYKDPDGNFTPGALTGLHPVKNQAGTSPQVNDYAVSATYASTIGEGCIVGLTETGVILAATTSLPSILGVAAETIAGTPGANTTVTVFDDPNQQYYLSADAVSSDTVIVVGRFSNVVSNVYNATVGYGKTQLDTSEITSVIASGDLVQIMGFPTDVGETKAATDAQMRVQLTQRFLIFKNTDITTHVT